MTNIVSTVILSLLKLAFNRKCQVQTQNTFRYAQSLGILLVVLGCRLHAQNSKRTCATCHPKETASYLLSSMANSLRSPDFVSPGQVADPQSGSRIVTEWRKGKMVHHLSENGLNASYEIKYQIGAGKVGHSYATQIGDVLMESPVSYYRRYGWDISPGFSGMELLDFNRALSVSCLFCHSNATQLTDERRVPSGQLSAISCERCHGETDEHLMHPSAANIVNPAKLPVRARDSVCEQCHLEGAARVLNPGKELRDYRPGSNLESTLVIYVQKQRENGITAVSQEEQLALSKCAIQSNGKLWCGTCHNPHSHATDRNAEVKAICLSCHATLSPVAHSPNPPECVSCHMPRRAPSDVAHAALTDHRILARPAAKRSESPTVAEGLRAWHEPVPEVQSRDLALADLKASATPGLASLANQAGNLLKSLPPVQLDDDAVVNAALGDINLSRNDAAAAVPFFRRACKLEPSSGEYAMFLGIALKQTDPAGAIRELRRAISLDASLERAYLELSALYQSESHSSDAADVLNDYLKWNPQSILVRLTKEGLAGPR